LAGREQRKKAARRLQNRGEVATVLQEEELRYEQRFIEIENRYYALLDEILSTSDGNPP
jgi:hypothetical protein